MQKVDVIEGLGKYHRRIFVFLPEEQVVKQLVYFHGTPGDGEELAEKLWEAMEKRMGACSAGLVMLGVEDWNGDLSPWKAKGIDKKGKDFSGGGKAYLTDLCNQVIPEIETGILGRERRNQGEALLERRIIGGYSMGGLFALYALCESTMFTDMISISGSLWYDGIEKYVSEQMCSKRQCSDTPMGIWGKRKSSDIPKRAYFSLGRQEPKTRNTRMSRVGEQTIAIKNILAQQGLEAHFEWNPGNHFQDVIQRIEKGIGVILEENNYPAWE